MSETFEQWLDQNDHFDPENDPHPERNFCSEVTMAKILGISPRHLRRLSKQDVIPRMADGTYPRLSAFDAFMAYRDKPNTAANRLQERKAEVIAARLKREALSLISMEETLATFDHIIERFCLAVFEVGNRIGTPDASAQCARAVAELRIKFAASRSALITGKEVADD